jgi:E3 ubiquitin-protein ligase HUWE1
MKKANIKKSKGKEKDKHALSKYPMVVLMSLLDRPVFTSNSGLMEQLMHFLATICRPLPALVKKAEEKEEVKAKQVSNTDDKEKTTSADGGQAAKTDEPAPKAEGQSTTAAHKFLPKPPVIPETYIKMVVHVLTTGECSSRTFQYTLNVISHLSALDGAQQVITKELVADASQSGAQIREDLKELHSVMENTMSGVDIQGTTLTKFSPASSQQAKLLRVLKTIDYMYSRKQSAESKSKDKQAAASDETSQKNEERILKIYDELQFNQLWKLLGSCLAVVHE